VGILPSAANSTATSSSKCCCACKTTSVHRAVGNKPTCQDLLDLLASPYNRLKCHLTVVLHMHCCLISIAGVPAAMLLVNSS
jgi:hypothetical protein